MEREQTTRKKLYVALSLIPVLGLAGVVDCDGGGTGRGEEELDPMDELIVNDIYELVGDNDYGSSINSNLYVLGFDHDINTYRMWTRWMLPKLSSER